MVGESRHLNIKERLARKLRHLNIKIRLVGRGSRCLNTLILEGRVEAFKQNTFGREVENYVRVLRLAGGSRRLNKMHLAEGSRHFNIKIHFAGGDQGVKTKMRVRGV